MQNEKNAVSKHGKFAEQEAMERMTVGGDRGVKRSHDKVSVLMFTMYIVPTYLLYDQEVLTHFM